MKDRSVVCYPLCDKSDFLGRAYPIKHVYMKMEAPARGPHTFHGRQTFHGKMTNEFVPNLFYSCRHVYSPFLCRGFFFPDVYSNAAAVGHMFTILDELSSQSEISIYRRASPPHVAPLDQLNKLMSFNMLMSSKKKFVSFSRFSSVYSALCTSVHFWQPVLI